MVLLFYNKVNLKLPIIEGLIKGVSSSRNEINSILKAGVIWGLLAGLFMMALFFVLQSNLPADYLNLGEKLKLHILTRFLYGGITEEVLMRFGFMTFIVWLLSKIVGNLNSKIYWIAIIIAALLFGLGHFPIVFMMVESPSFILLSFILLANMIGGIIFGWLYWKKGLEAAIVGHIFAHIAMLALEQLMYNENEILNMEHNSTFPIKQNELDMLRDEATSYLKSVQWEQGQRAKNKDSDGKDESILLYLSRANNGSNVNVTSVSKTILALKKRLLPESVAIPLDLNQTLYAVQEGLTLGIWIKDSYYDASGLSSLSENKSALDSNGKREYESKMHTATAFMLFASAYKILHDLKPHASDDLSVMKQKFAGIPEVSLMSPLKGISCSLFYYDKYLGHPDIIKSDKDVIDFSVVYFEALIDEIQLRKSSLEYTETIVDRTYKLEKSDFAVSGWDNMFQGSAKSVEFNKIQFEQIVGNRDAKHFARRLTERMLSYDFEAKKNPFQELGGFMPVFMGYGIPGTGKSMLIAAIATRLKEHCDNLDIPFLFHPMPDTLISTFQGGSAEKMVEWMKPLQDPSKLIFAPIDDAENNLQERTAQGVSAGVKEVIGVFLRYTEGAYAVNYGNSSIGLFTNLPEMLDKAVISRVQGRFLIDGARTEHDFLDQDHLWWRKLDKTMPDFVNMQGPKDYSYLQDQGLAKNMGEILKVSDKPNEERVLKAYDITENKFKTNEHLFYANLYQEIQKIFPFFSSRDVRNIQSAVSLRLTDFDLEQDWFDNPEIYFKKDYETKFNMLQELMRANMKGLNFSEIRRQEVVRYLDNVATIADTDFKRKVDARVNQLNIDLEAREQFGKRD